MDAQGFAGIIVGFAAVAGTAYSVGRKQVSASLNEKVLEPVRKDIELLDRQVHRHSNRLALIPEKPDDVYVRKETLAPQLKAITDSLERIEERQTTLVDRLINGGV